MNDRPPVEDFFDKYQLPPISDLKPESGTQSSALFDEDSMKVRTTDSRNLRWLPAVRKCFSSPRLV